MGKYHQDKSAAIQLVDPRFKGGIQRLLDVPKYGIGSDPDPYFRYIGDGCEPGVQVRPNGYGEALATAGGGAPYTVENTPFGEDGAMAAPAASERFDAPTNAYSNIGTDDFIFESVSATYETAGIAYSFINTNYVDGWTASSTRFLGYDDGSVQNFNNTKTNLPSMYEWRHDIFICHFSARKTQWYTNGQENGYAVFSSVFTGGLNWAGKGYIPSAGRDRIAFMSLSMAPSWLSSHLQAAMASDRFALLTNSRIRKSWAGAAFNIDVVRAGIAESRNIVEGEEKIFIDGDNLLRPDRKIISDGSIFDAVLTEGEVINTNHYSSTLASWSMVFNVTATDFNVTTPAGPLTGTTLTEAAVNAAHLAYWLPGANNATQSVDYAFHCLIQPGANSGWVSLQILEATGTRTYVNVNLDTGAIGTIDTSGASTLDAPTEVHIDSIGGGWYECRFKTQAVHATNRRIGPRIVFLQSDAASGSDSYLGSVARHVHVAKFNVTQESYGGSFIDTPAAATVTRAEDIVEVDITGYFDNEISLSGEFWLPSFTPTRNHQIIQLREATGLNNIFVYIDTTGGMTMYGTVGGAQESIAQIADVYAANKVTKWRLEHRDGYTVIMTKKTGDSVYTSSAIDTNAITPTGLTKAFISATLYPGTWRNIKLGDRLLTTRGG